MTTAFLPRAARPAAETGREPARPRARHARVTLLVPAKNEESGIRETLASLPVDALRRAGHPTEILVVDGKSTDRTREIAATAGARVLVQVGMGKGNAVRGALRATTADYVVMLDADATYPAERAPDFVRYLDEGFDVVMGSRLRGEIALGALSPMNRVGNVGLSALASVLFGRRCTDVCTGMWGFRRDALARLPLESEGFEIEAEIFAEAVKAGLNILEVPIRYGARRGTTKLNKLGDGARIAARLLRSRVNRPFRPMDGPHAADPGAATAG